MPEQLTMFDVQPQQKKKYKREQPVKPRPLELGRRVEVLDRRGVVAYIGVGKIDFADDHWHNNTLRNEYHKLHGLDLVPKESLGVLVAFDSTEQPDWRWKTLRSVNVA